MSSVGAAAKQLERVRFLSVRRRRWACPACWGPYHGPACADAHPGGTRAARHRRVQSAYCKVCKSTNRRDPEQGRQWEAAAGEQLRSRAPVSPVTTGRPCTRRAQRRPGRQRAGRRHSTPRHTRRRPCPRPPTPLALAPPRALSRASARPRPRGGPPARSAGRAALALNPAPAPAQNPHSLGRPRRAGAAPPHSLARLPHRRPQSRRGPARQQARLPRTPQERRRRALLARPAPLPAGRPPARPTERCRSCGSRRLSPSP